MKSDPANPPFISVMVGPAGFLPCLMAYDAHNEEYRISSVGKLRSTRDRANLEAAKMAERYKVEVR